MYQQPYQQQQPMYQQPMMQQQQPMMMQQPMQQPVYQQPGYQQPMMMQQPVMQQPIVQPIVLAQPQTTAIIINNLKNNCSGSRMPQQFNCPHCNTQQTSKTTTQFGSNVWVWVVILFMFAFPLCFLPLLMDNCHDVIHTCPQCRNQVGYTNGQGC